MPDLVEQVIEHLEYSRTRGEKYVSLSLANVQYLFPNRNKSPSPEPSVKVAPKPVPKKRRPDGDSEAGTNSSTTASTDSFDEPNLNVSLPELAQVVSHCNRCRLCHSRTRTVFGVGTEKASLMFIGDGPTHKDEQSGTPFSDNSGELLNRMIEAMGFSRDEVYLTNVIKCSPPIKRPPGDDEVPSCFPYLKREIELIQPRVIVLLGPVPVKALIDKQGISKVRGKWQSFNGIDCMPTYHPSYLLRMPAAKRDVWEDLKAVMRKLGK